MLQRLISFIYPPECILCRQSKVQKHNTVCEDCLATLDFAYGATCFACGDFLSTANLGAKLSGCARQPRPLSTIGTAPPSTSLKGDPQNFFAAGFFNGFGICNNCVTRPVGISEFLYAFSYERHFSLLLAAYKYGDRIELYKYLAKILAYTYVGSMSECSGVGKAIDLVIPMPSSVWRVMKRKFHHVGLLAYYFSLLLELPCDPNILLKKHNTKAQASLKLKERLQNVKGSFRVSKDKISKLQGKEVLLIDDVVTTGSTISEAVNTLLEAGAFKVSVLCLARVPGEFKCR